MKYEELTMSSTLMNKKVHVQIRSGFEENKDEWLRNTKGHNEYAESDIVWDKWTSSYGLMNNTVYTVTRYKDWKTENDTKSERHIMMIKLTRTEWWTKGSQRANISWEQGMTNRVTDNKLMQL